MRILPEAVFIVIAAGSLSCGSADEVATGVPTPDADARAELARIEKILATGQPLLPSDYRSLKAIESSYSGSPKVRDVYKSALIRREDWAALAEYLEGIAATSRSVTDRANLAKAYLRLGRFEEAIRTAKPLADGRPADIEIHGLLSAGYYGAGRYEEAATTLDRFWPVISSENRAGDMILRGLIHARLGSDEEALAVLLRAVEISPGETAALNEISRIYASRGEVEKAKEFSRRLERAHADRSAAKRRAIRQVELGYELQKRWAQEQYEDVIRVARRLLEISDDRTKPMLYQFIAESYVRLGRPEDARSALAEMETPRP